MENKIAFARQLRSNQTNVEQLLWKYLRNRRLNGIKFRRQHLIGPYIVYFVSLEKQLIIELDGGQHNSEDGKKKDKERTLWLKNNGYQLMRFWNNEVINDIDVVLQLIQNALTLPSPKSSPFIPLPEGEDARRGGIKGRGERGRKII